MIHWSKKSTPWGQAPILVLLLFAGCGDKPDRGLGPTNGEFHNDHGAKLTVSATTAAGRPEKRFTFTFDDGPQGWVGDFADLPANFAADDFNLVFDPARPLPAELNDRRAVPFLSGVNRSDDLFMYLRRHFEGLKPNTAYAVHVGLQLATAVPAGLVGVGGAPGESVFVRVGVALEEPVPVVRGDDIRLVLEKGNQSQDGPFDVVVGNIAKPTSQALSVYEFKRLDNRAKPLSVTTDPSGSVWVFVGTDSGFESLTALYYSRIDITFTQVDGDREVSPAEPEEGAPSMLLSNSDGRNDRWRGIGHFRGSSQCTAVLIATGNEDGPAYALSNGHCIEWLANGAVTDVSTGDVIFNFFVDTQEQQIPVPVARVAYSTMQGLDVAILELEPTLGSLRVQGLQPFELAQTPLPIGEQVRVLGIPVVGIDAEESFLRQEVCRTTGRADLLEFEWHFFDTYRTTCQDIFGGSSGSPLFSTESNTLYALINTVVAGDTPCYLGMPCEIGEGQVALNPMHSYATPVDGLGACFGGSGRFALTPDCPLPPIDQLELSGFPLSAGMPPLTWDLTLSGTQPFYRYKTGPASATDCRVPDGYSAPIALADRSHIDDPIPTGDGAYLFCVQAGESPSVDATWQSLDHPTVIWAEVDTVPPTKVPQLHVQDFGDSYRVEPLFEVPELSDFLLKVGPANATDCATDEDYFRYRRIPIRIPKADAPVRVCVIGFDFANNATPPLDTVLGQ